MFAAVLGISLILIKFQIFEMEFILLNTSEYYCLKKTHRNKQTNWLHNTKPKPQTQKNPILHRASIFMQLQLFTANQNQVLKFNSLLITCYLQVI